jgi:TP901 family phage tail tape measure protein
VANLDIIIRAQNLASAALRQVEGQLSGIQRQASFAERGFGGLQRAVGVGMVAAAGLAVVGVGALAVGLAKSVTAAADFESQINILTVAARSSGTTMDDLSKAALQVGADSDLVGISASEAADAMTNFYKAGLTTNEIFADMQGYLAGTVPLTGALRSAIDLAAASELDLAAASDVVAVAMATFGLEASDAARIADTLVGAADASLASVGGLAEGLRNIGPVAASMGISLEDTTTALALLSTRGIQGAEAGTAMRSMLLNLQRPTAAVTETLDALGVSLYNTDGTMRSLPDVIGALEGAMSGLTEEQRQQVAVTLAGSYGLSAFNVLVGEGAAGWDAMAGAVANAASAQEVAAARTQGFNAAIEQLKGALETFLITVGMPLIQEFLTPAAQGLGGVIVKLTAMAPSVEQVRAGYDALVKSGTELLGHINAVVGPIVEAIGQFVSWQDVLVALGIVLASIVVPALAGIVVAAAPVIAVGAALVASVALVRTAWENDWGGIQAKTATVTGYLHNAFTNLQGWLTTNLPSGLTSLRSAWDTVSSALQNGLASLQSTWNTIFPTLQTTASALVEFFTPAMTRIKEALDTAGESLAPLGEKFSALWTAAQPVMSALGTAFEVVSGIIGTVLVVQLNVLMNAFAAIIPAIVAIVGVMVDQLTAFFETITELWASTVEMFTTLINGDWAGAWAAAGEIVQTFADYWQTTLDNLLAVGTAIFTAIKETVVNTLTDMGVNVGAILQALTATWETIWNDIKAKTISIVGVITGVLNQIAVFASVTVPNAITAFKTFLGGLTLPNPFIAINTAISGIQSAIDGAKSAINSFKSWLGSISIPNPFSGFSLPNVGGLLGGNASGTGFFGGGLTLVGERGPEIVMLPRGSRIESSERTSQMMGNGGMTVNVYATVSNQMDVEELAYRVAQTIQRRQR